MSNNVFSKVWEDTLLRRSIVIHYTDMKTSFHHVFGLHLFRYS